MEHDGNQKNNIKISNSLHQIKIYQFHHSITPSPTLDSYIYIYIYIYNIWHLHSLSIDESQSYVWEIQVS